MAKKGDVSRGAYEQVAWERDIAMGQLEEFGIPFGGKGPVSPEEFREWVKAKTEGRLTIQPEKNPEPQNRTPYEKAKDLRAQIEKKCAELRPELEELKKELSEFYELMRWTNLGCSEEEYEALYEGLIRSYEANEIDWRLKVLTLFMDPNLRQ